VSAIVPVRLVKGTDDVLRGEALMGVIDEAVGDADRSLVLDEFDLDHTSLTAAIDAAQTPPFLTDHRVVVVRRFNRFSKNEDVAPLVAYLEDPQPTTALILSCDKAAVTSQTETGEPIAKAPKVPPALTKAIAAAGGAIVETGAGRNMDAWVQEQLGAAGLDVDPSARKRIVATIGEDGGALVGIMENLKGAYAPGARLRLDDVEPFVGATGGVPPWDLTDAIDQGDVALAIGQVQRMMAGGGRHALAVMAPLQTHYVRMLRLDGANVRGEKDAAAVLGLKGSTFPAKKALAQGRKLGSATLRRSVALLAQADVDLRGAQAWPDELVMEVLVARLARLARSGR